MILGMGHSQLVKDSQTQTTLLLCQVENAPVLLVNMLKPYLTPQASVHRFVVVEEGHDWVIDPSSLVQTDDGKS